MFCYLVHLGTVLVHNIQITCGLYSVKMELVAYRPVAIVVLMLDYPIMNSRYFYNSVCIVLIIKVGFAGCLLHR